MPRPPKNRRQLAFETAKKKRRQKPKPRPNEVLYLGQWLHQLGKEQSEIAKAAGIGKSYMSLMVSGKKDNPAALKLLRISRALGVSVNNLYEPPPSKEEMERFRQMGAGQVATIMREIRPEQ